MQVYEIEKIDFFDGFDGKSIRYGVFGNNDYKKVIAVFQGRAECFDKYQHIVKWLINLDYLVFSMDWRGQGGSVRELPDREKGFVSDFKDYQKDLSIFLHKIIKPYLNGYHLDILAHSMGGYNLMRYVIENEDNFINKMLLCSPMFGINTHPFPVFGAELIAATALKLGFGNSYVFGAGKYKEIKFDKNPLTSNYNLFVQNQSFLRENKNLALGGVTFTWLFNAFKAMNSLENSYKNVKINTDIEILYGSEDKVVSIDKIHNTCSSLGIKSFEIKNAKHEIMMETDDILDIFYKECYSFLQS